MKNSISEINSLSRCISNTIGDYFKDRRREYNNLCSFERSCVDMSIRRKLRERKQHLKEILSRDLNFSKISLSQQLGVSYKKLKAYPDLVEIKRKEQLLKRDIYD